MPHKHRANHQHQPPHSGADAVKVTRTKRAASSPYPRTSSPEADAAQDEVRDELRALHADELAYLSQHWRASRVPRAVERSYTYLFWRTTRRYFLYLWQTWSRAMWSTFFLPTSEWPVSRPCGGWADARGAAFFDRLSIVAFAWVSSWIVFFLLVWCLAANHPLLIRAFNHWSRTHANGLSMINAGACARGAGVRRR